VEEGTHEELVAQGGLYSQLHQAQTRIRSRSRTEGGAAYEEQLIDSITQEVGDRIYSGAGDDGEVESPPALEPSVVEPPAPEPSALDHHVPESPGPPTPAPETPAEAPPAEPAQPAAQPAQPSPEPAGEPLELAASAGPPATGDGNGATVPGIGDDNGARNGRRQVVKKIRDGLQDDEPEVVCGYCQRTLLKGERAEPFIVPFEGRRRRSSRYDSMPDAGLGDMFSLRRGQGGDLQRKLVCEICWGMAEQDGWAPLHVIERDK
jgi:hypothetical protein